MLHQAVTGHVHRQLDHRNRNGHDNRTVNLRPCTHAEAGRKTSKQSFAKAASSRYKGVSKIHDRCWQASITVDGHQIYLGRFGLETDAAIAYNYHAAYLHGEFASLNDLSDIVYIHD
jgi:hypothetical protein